MVEQISRLRKLKVVMPEVTHILENNTPNTTMDDPNLELYTFILDLFWINLKLLDFVLGSVI